MQRAGLPKRQAGPAAARPGGSFVRVKDWGGPRRRCKAWNSADAQGPCRIKRAGRTAWQLRASLEAGQQALPRGRGQR